MYNYYDYDDDYGYDYEYDPNDELYHFGVKGMKWGVRRYQNADGSPTAAGRGRYNRGGGIRGHFRRNWKKYAAGAALLGAAGLAYRNRAAIGRAYGNLRNRFQDNSAGAVMMRNLRSNGRPIVGKKARSIGRLGTAMNTVRNVGGNYVDAAGRKVRSGLTRVGMTSRGLSSALGSGARSAVGTLRNVGGNYASAAGRRFRSGAIAVGSRTRSAMKGIAGSVRNIGGNYASAAGRRLASTATRVGSTLRYDKRARIAAGVGAAAGLGAAGYGGYRAVRRRRRR